MQKYKEQSAAAFMRLYLIQQRQGTRTPTCGEKEGRGFGKCELEKEQSQLVKIDLQRKYEKNKAAGDVPLVLKSAVEAVTLKKRKGIKSTW